MFSTNRRYRTPFVVLVGLLILLGATTQVATARQAVPFRAVLVTINEAPVQCDATHICIPLASSGWATHLGRVTDVSQVKIDLASQPGPTPSCTNNERNMLLTGANGDQLALLINGVNCDTGASTGITGISRATWVVVGGTGRFSGASGSGTATAFINLPESTAWEYLSGTITLANSH